MAEVQVDSPTQANSQENKPLTKTQESIQSKADKSYYYWHPHVGNKVKIESPTLLRKEEKPVDAILQELQINPDEISFKKVTNYAWMDDDSNVKIYVDLAKLGSDGKEEVVAPLQNEDVTCDITASSFDLKIKNYKGSNYRLSMSNLREEVDVEKSSFRFKTKVIISLAKKDSSKRWYDLVSKKKD